MAKTLGPKLAEPFEKFVERLVVQIKAAWPKLADQSIGLYAGFIREQAAKHGREAAEKLVREAINHESELPSIAALKVYLPAESRRVTTSVKPDCQDCDGTGWMWADQEQKRVRRCHCWRKESA